MSLKNMHYNIYLIRFYPLHNGRSMQQDKRYQMDKNIDNKTNYWYSTFVFSPRYSTKLILISLVKKISSFIFCVKTAGQFFQCHVGKLFRIFTKIWNQKSTKRSTFLIKDTKLTQQPTFVIAFQGHKTIISRLETHFLYFSYTGSTKCICTQFTTQH